MRVVFNLFVTLLLLTSCEEGVSVQIPFKYERHIYIHCRLNDSVTGHFMFDTGAYGLYLDSLFNQVSGLRYSPDRSLESSGGSCPVSTPTDACSNYSSNGPIRFAYAGLSYSPEIVRIINTKPTFGKQCDGIVGWDFLKNYAVEIDYGRRLMTAINPDDLEPDASYQKIPLLFRNNLFIVNVAATVSDSLTVSGPFVFDLGFGGSCVFTGETLRQYGLDTIKTKKVEFKLDWEVTEKKKSSGFIFRGKAIKLNNFELAAPTMECYRDETGVLARGDYLGLLGNRFLEHFDVLIDFPGKALYMKPNAAYARKMEFKSAGFGFVDRTDICEGLVINMVETGSAADKQGLQPGDVITHIDGKPVKPGSEKIIGSFYGQTGKSRTITVKRKNRVDTFTVKVRRKL